MMAKRFAGVVVANQGLANDSKSIVRPKKQQQTEECIMRVRAGLVLWWGCNQMQPPYGGVLALHGLPSSVVLGSEVWVGLRWGRRWSHEGNQASTTKHPNCNTDCSH